MEGSLLGRANEKEMWVESIKTLREGNVLVPLRHTSLKTMSGRKDREGKRSVRQISQREFDINLNMNVWKHGFGE